VANDTWKIVDGKIMDYIHIINVIGVLGTVAFGFRPLVRIFSPQGVDVSTAQVWMLAVCAAMIAV